MADTITLMKQHLLDIAISGKLVEQRKEEGTTKELLAKLKEYFIQENKFKKEKKLFEITNNDRPFDIPESWEWAKISEVAQVNPRNQLDDNTTVGFIPMTLINDGYSNGYSYEDREWKDIKTGFTHFKQNDIVIAKITPCFENMKSAILFDLPNGYGAGTTELHVIRVNKNYILNKYIYLLFINNNFIEQGKRNFTGTAGHKRIGKEFITNYTFPLPPIAEQKRIVAKIESAFSIIDKINEKKEDSLQTIKNIRKTVLHNAIKGLLVEQNESDEPASELMKNIKAEKEQLIKNKKIKKENLLPDIEEYEIPFDIPESWEWVKLGTVTSIKGGKRIPKGMNFSEQQTPHAYLRVTDMKKSTISSKSLKYIDDNVYEKIKNYTINSNEIYLTIAGTIGKVGLIPEKFNQMNLTENACKINCFSIDKKFLMYQLSSNFVQQQFQNGYNQLAQPKLSIRTTENTIISLPPLSEQKRIVKKIEQVMELCDKMKEILDGSRNELIREVIAH